MSGRQAKAPVLPRCIKDLQSGRAGAFACRDLICSRRHIRIADIYLKPTMRIRFLILLLLAAAAQPAEFFLYSGSYTAGKSKGINVSRFDSATGKLEAIGLAGESPNPTFLAVHPNQRFLYTVNNLPGKPGNTVSGFAIDRNSGKLTALNQVEPGGEGPSHLTVDHSGKWLAV